MPTHSVAWAVGAADQSSVAGWALQSSAITNTTPLRAPQLLPPTTPPHTPLSHRPLPKLTCGELLNGHRWDLHSLRPICNLRLRRSSEFRCRGCPFSLEFLLCDCFLSSRLLLLFNLQGKSTAWVSQEHIPEHNPYCHVSDNRHQLAIQLTYHHSRAWSAITVLAKPVLNSRHTGPWDRSTNRPSQRQTPRHKAPTSSGSL